MPQDNPNLDYLPAPVVYPHSSYTGSPHMMHQLGPHYDGDMHDRSYGSFTSGGSTPGMHPARIHWLSVTVQRCRTCTAAGW